MREIKFRAYDTNTGEMHVVTRLDLIVPSPYLPAVCFENGYRDEPTPIDECKIMQYTGLKDKNGKEIYEGDIVIWENILCEIKWYEHSFWLWNDKSLVKGRSFSKILDEIEVIGNIYEHPHLLAVQRG